jgi:hypothetical protein
VAIHHDQEVVVAVAVGHNASRANGLVVGDLPA